MIDRLFWDDRLAAVYDAICGVESRDDFRFHLRRVMRAASVLDVGCGTGAMFHLAREAGHTGRLCGVDPAAAMLEQARKRTDIEWMLGDLGSVGFDREFDLVVMTGHAFQVFTADDELRVALAAIRAALTDDGRFAFETRNPKAREWEQWTPDQVLEGTGPDGEMVRCSREVNDQVEGDLVRFTSTFTCASWDGPEQSRSTLRFLDAPALATFLADAGFAIEEQFGDWDASPLTDLSPEIIVIARRA